MAKGTIKEILKKLEGGHAKNWRPKINNDQQTIYFSYCRYKNSNVVNINNNTKNKQTKGQRGTLPQNYRLKNCECLWKAVARNYMECWTKIYYEYGLDKRYKTFHSAFIGLCMTGELWKLLEKKASVGIVIEVEEETEEYWKIGGYINVFSTDNCYIYLSKMYLWEVIWEGKINGMWQTIGTGVINKKGEFSTTIYKEYVKNTLGLTELTIRARVEEWTSNEITLKLIQCPTNAEIVWLCFNGTMGYNQICEGNKGAVIFNAQDLFTNGGNGKIRVGNEYGYFYEDGFLDPCIRGFYVWNITGVDYFDIVCPEYTGVYCFEFWNGADAATGLPMPIWIYKE